MLEIGCRTRRALAGLLAAGWLLGAGLTRGQEAPRDTVSSELTSQVRMLGDSVRDLQAQVEALSAQLKEVRDQEQSARTEVRELRDELDRKNASAAPSSDSTAGSYAASTAEFPTTPPNVAAKGAAAQQDLSVEERISKIEDNQQLSDAKLNDQYQTKVDSGSKYRVRLSGIVLLNMFENRGVVDNVDFPEIALEPGSLDSSGTFGGSLRQSQIGLEVFGPEVAGAHTSADVRFDFSGGFPDTPNGSVTGLVRLRTGTIRLDWANTSIVAGQDFLFFSPLAPTSLAMLAVPPLSYAGNLWSWTPQVRIEHRINFSDKSSLLVEGGILDALSGDLPYSQYERYPSWGEESGQPAYAGRVAWSHTLFGQKFTAGQGGYYGRQYWGFGRNVNGWAVTTDLSLPLGEYFGFTGAFYRGRALGGLGGGIGQDVLMSGSLISGATAIQGLDSMGGWVQLKFKPVPKFEVNGALGDDNPFGSELRRFPSSVSYYGPLLSRNFVPFINFIYQPRSDVKFSVEYRRLKTYVFQDDAYTANHINVSLGYIF